MRKGWSKEVGVEQRGRGGTRETCSGMSHLPEVLPAILLPSLRPSPYFLSDFHSEGKIVPSVIGGSKLLTSALPQFT